MSAPDPSRHFGTLSRRALLAGGLSAFISRPGRAEDALEAGKLAGGRLGYGGASPGPVLRGKVGEPLRLTLVNGLDTPTSFALSGLRAESAFPGLTATLLAPGERRALILIPAEPGFALYGAYDRAASVGLFGAVVIEETAPPPVDLDAVALFSGEATAFRVNGAAPPLTLAARPGARVRLRLAHIGTDALLALEAPPGVQVVAIDGQPCEMFTPAAGALPLTPSARFELLFDLGDAPAGFNIDGRPALRFVPSGVRAAARPPIAPLPANPRLPVEIALEKALRVTVKLSEFAINGVSGADWPRIPLFQARRGQPVVLRLTNQTLTAQTMRLEGHWARQLHNLDDGWDPYWRDALHVDAGRTLHAAFVADAPGKWPLASASPDSRAKGLATWFQVA